MKAKKNRMVLLWVGVTILTAAVLVGEYFYFQHNKQEENLPIVITMEGKPYKFLLADTPEERVQGLSGKDSLPSDTVMLFDFEKEDDCGIWMKNMKFTIDIIWLDNNFKVIDFKENASPETYPMVFSPISPCRYVVEANEGFVEHEVLQIGDKVSIDFDNSTLKIIRNLQQQ